MIEEFIIRKNEDGYVLVVKSVSGFRDKEYFFASLEHLLEGVSIEEARTGLNPTARY